MTESAAPKEKRRECGQRDLRYRGSDYPCHLIEGHDGPHECLDKDDCPHTWRDEDSRIKCEDLARYFLPAGTSAEIIRELAQAIQDATEERIQQLLRTRSAKQWRQQ